MGEFNVRGMEQLKEKHASAVTLVKLLSTDPTNVESLLEKLDGKKDKGKEKEATDSAAAAAALDDD